MATTHVKKGDLVVVIRGAHAGQRGKILEMTDARTRAVVEGVNLVKRALRKGASADKPEGGIIEREAPLPLSKLMLASRWDERRARRTGAAPARRAAAR